MPPGSPFSAVHLHSHIGFFFFFFYKTSLLMQRSRHFVLQLAACCQHFFTASGCVRCIYIFIYFLIKIRSNVLTQSASERLNSVSCSHQSPTAAHGGHGVLLMHKYLTIQCMNCEQWLWVLQKCLHASFSASYWNFISMQPFRANKQKQGQFLLTCLTWFNSSSIIVLKPITNWQFWLIL